MAESRKQQLSAVPLKTPGPCVGRESAEEVKSPEVQVGVARPPTRPSDDELLSCIGRRSGPQARPRSRSGAQTPPLLLLQGERVEACLFQVAVPVVVVPEVLTDWHLEGRPVNECEGFLRRKYLK